MGKGWRVEGWKGGGGVKNRRMEGRQIKMHPQERITNKGTNMINEADKVGQIKDTLLWLILI
jgi:hypothetical protein